VTTDGVQISSPSAVISNTLYLCARLSSISSLPCRKCKLPGHAKAGLHRNRWHRASVIKLEKLEFPLEDPESQLGFMSNWSPSTDSQIHIYICAYIYNIYPTRVHRTISAASRLAAVRDKQLPHIFSRLSG